MQSKAISLTINRPSGKQVVTPQIRFEAVSDASQVVRTTYGVYSDASLLLPPASISEGQFWPYAHIRLDMDNPNPVFTADHVGPYTPPIGQQGPWMCNPGGSNACGKAWYSASTASS